MEIRRDNIQLVKQLKQQPEGEYLLLLKNWNGHCGLTIIGWHGCRGR